MRQYHEIYGFMPKDVINRLSQSDRNEMIIEWLSREPTPTGWFFTKTVIAALGDDFINYLFEKVDEGINSDGEEVTREGGSPGRCQRSDECFCLRYQHPV